LKNHRLLARAAQNGLVFIIAGGSQAMDTRLKNHRVLLSKERPFVNKVKVIVENHHGEHSRGDENKSGDGERQYAPREPFALAF
jgi:hypothetical protein